MFFTKEYADIVIENQNFMFSYHSGLVAEHPYSSKWYQWMLDIRPILYYLDYLDGGKRSSFGAFRESGAVLGRAYQSFSCWPHAAIFRKDKTAAFILAGYLAQLLPWVLITRLTFEYHYFPCTVFLVLSLGYCFAAAAGQSALEAAHRRLHRRIGRVSAVLPGAVRPCGG